MVSPSKNTETREVLYRMSPLLLRFSGVSARKTEND